MSSAPPGWHLQPDGRERYWDGERWTDEFRTPGSAPTEQIPLDETRDMPAAGTGAYGTPAQAGQGPGGYASPPSGAYGQPGPGQPGYGQPGYGQPGYGEGGPLSDKPRGSGWGKGCLIALLVVALLAAILVAVGVWLFRAANDAVSESISTSVPTEVPTELPTEVPTELPTELPTGLPTDLPTELPTGLPTDLPSLPGQGATAEAGLGEEFTLGPATIQSGWTVEDVTLGFASVVMQAVPTEGSTVPLIFDLVFFEGDTDVTRTTCSVPLEPVGETVDVACVPVRGFTDGIDRIEASGVGSG
ncbi:DUF2510 domain-containing protein [Nostocoides sp. F2B08]|uniref:DUF2510 domain-containing protein n=1 Tax=Nostocoides sp. F2B08 TaxID=2653936 RepID=UPI00186B02DC|nr:DUF2510 domain-containing protein [Tetrasphaera sp. F2B08]